MHGLTEAVRASDMIIPAVLFLKGKTEGTAILQPVEAKEIPVEQAVFNQAWRLVKAYSRIEEYGMNEEWKSLLKEADQIYLMGETPDEKELAKGMAQLVLRYLDLRGMDKGRASS